MHSCPQTLTHLPKETSCILDIKKVGRNMIIRMIMNYGICLLLV